MTSQNPFLSAIWKNGGNFGVIFFLWVMSEFTLKYQPENLFALNVQMNIWLANLFLYIFFVVREYKNLSKVQK